MQELVKFFAVAVLGVPILSAFAGAATRLTIGDDYWVAWRRWFLGNALANLLLTPMILYWIKGGVSAVRSAGVKRCIEGVLLLIALILVEFKTFSDAGRQGASPVLIYLPFPLLLYAAVRFGPRGISSALSLVTAFAIWNAELGRGPFSTQAPGGDILSLQLFLCVISVPLLCLSVLLRERQRVGEALRESEARFRNMADYAPVMVWITEPDGICSYLSQSWYGFTGQTPETGLRFGWIAALHPDDRELSEKTFLAADKKREAFRLEYRLLRKDGEYRWASDSAIPRFGSQGEFLGYIGSVVDITENKRAELDTQFINQLNLALSQIADADEIVRLATGRLGEYLGVTSCYLIEVDSTADMAIVRANWDGWSHDAPNIVGEYRIRDYVTPELIEALKAGQATVVNDVRSDPRTRDFASKYELLGVGAFVSVPALNEKLWEASLTVNYSQARDWRPYEIQLIRDISARLWPAFKKARASEALRLALESGRMGVWEWDTMTNVLKWSREHYTIMGLTPFSVEPDYYTWADRVHPDDLPRVMETVRRAIEEKKDYQDEYRIIRTDSAVRWVEGRGKPVYDEGGRCLKVNGLIVDISERKESEEALRKNEEALRKSHARIEDLAGRLIAAQENERRHIARELHDDLNQQVAALAISISRLKRQFPNAGPAFEEQIARLHEKTELLSERIRQVSHELHSSVLQHVGLPAALNSYCAEFSDREGIAVALDIQDGLGDMPSDTALCLYRVAQESLRNVARHSGARRAVVALSCVNGAVELRVADQGVGFDPGQAREFRGLGLVSMEERVKLLSGSLELTTRPGAGTELRAQISLRREHEQTKSIAG